MKPSILKLAMSLALAVTQSTRIIKMETGEAWILAKVAEGEVGGLFPGEDAEKWVMWTVRNRVESRNFPDDYWSVIEHGYHGHRQTGEPSEEMITMALGVMDADPDDDPTDGSLFVFSSDDIAAHGFSVSTAVRVVQNGRWGLYFFKEMPERKK